MRVLELNQNKPRARFVLMEDVEMSKSIDAGRLAQSQQSTAI